MVVPDCGSDFFGCRMEYLSNFIGEWTSTVDRFSMMSPASYRFSRNSNMNILEVNRMGSASGPLLKMCV